MGGALDEVDGILFAAPAFYWPSDARVIAFRPMAGPSEDKRKRGLLWRWAFVFRRETPAGKVTSFEVVGGARVRLPAHHHIGGRRGILAVGAGLRPCIHFDSTEKEVVRQPRENSERPLRPNRP